LTTITASSTTTTQRIVIFPQVKNSIIDKKNKIDETFYIYGRILQNEYTYQLLDLDEKFENLKSIDQQQYLIKNIGRVTIVSIKSGLYSSASIEFELANSITFTLPIDELMSKRRIIKNGFLISGSNPNKSTEIEIIIADLSRLYIRVDNLIDYPLKWLNRKKIAIIGLGSGGSLIAMYLAKAGIKNFLLIDEDIYEDHNIIRHICSLSNLGRYKTFAVRDHILERIPDLNILTIEESFKIDTETEEEKYRTILKDYDLLISATGDHTINMRINQFAYRFGIPVIYAGTFNKIIGGIMIRVDPTMGDTCYNCIYRDDKTEQINDTNNNNNANEITEKEIPNLIATEQSVNYDRNLEDILSQPGLGIDIDNITIFVVKFILYNLLKDNSYQNNMPNISGNQKINDINRQTEIDKIHSNNNNDGTLYKFAFPIYIWYNRDTIKKTGEEEHIIKDGLELYYYDNDTMNNHIKKKKDCSICTFENFI
jgi:molybdopterin/thiamine biosynthesis adenylyltransferase